MTFYDKKILNKIMAIVLALALGVGSSFGQVSYDTISASEMETIATDTLPDIEYNSEFSELPMGETSEFDISFGDGTEMEMSGGYSYRNGIDFGEYITTSGGTVTIIKGAAGAKGGISLGCNGLDLGLEALFEMEMGDILKYLPQYILSKLAVEALAQIYALPLVSTVMDGLKSMQNFFAEMKKGGCNMDKVMTRAKEIQAAGIQECVDNYTQDSWVSDEAAYSMCTKPSKIEEAVNGFKERVNQTISSSESLVGLLGVPYDDSEWDGDPEHAEGRVLSTGRLVAMFVPDVKFGSGDGANVEENPDISVSDTYRHAFRVGYTAMSRVYKDIILSAQEEGISADNYPRLMSAIDKYKNHLMAYGSSDVYEDTASAQTYNDVDAIKEDYKSASTFSFVKSLGVNEVFTIGSEDGGAGGTDLTGYAKKMLEAGEYCFVKSEKTEESSSDYTWRPIHDDPEAIPYIDGADEGFGIINKIAYCKALKEASFQTIHNYNEHQHSLAEPFVTSEAKGSAYGATNMLVTFVQGLLKMASSNSEVYTAAYCKKKGVANLPHTAVIAGETGQAYKSCDQYVEQNKASKRMIEYWNGRSDKLESALSVAKTDAERARTMFEDARASLDLVMQSK